MPGLHEVLKKNALLWIFDRVLNMPLVLKGRYTNADLKICQYFCHHMKIICWRFHIKTPFIIWDMRTWDVWKVCSQIFRNNRIFLKYWKYSLWSIVKNQRHPLTSIEKIAAETFFQNTQEKTRTKIAFFLKHS